MDERDFTTEILAAMPEYYFPDNVVIIRQLKE